MAGSLPTLSYARQRFQYLRGETDYTTTDATIDSHLDAAQKDILNAYPFSFSIATTTGTLSSGSFNLAADYNPRWGLHDARIVNSSTGDDSVFKQIPITDRDSYSTDSYVWWPVYSTASNVYQFKTLTQSGTVTYYYHFLPNTLTAASDSAAQAVYLVVPDAELVALMAVAKMWLGDERNQQYMRDFLTQAELRLKALWSQDVAFGAQYDMFGPAIDQPQVNGTGVDTGLVIARP